MVGGHEPAAEMGPEMGDDDRKEWSRMELASMMNSFMLDLEQKQDRKIDRLIDGAQAAIYTQAMMVGDPAMGLEGFIPETKRRLGSLEESHRTGRELYTKRDEEQTARLTGIEASLVIIQNDKRRFRKMFREFAESATKSNGKWDYFKVAALTAAIYEGGSLVVPHIAHWWVEAKKLAVAIAVSLSK